MLKKQTILIALCILVALSACQKTQNSTVPAKQQEDPARTRLITGEIDKIRHNYIIRSTKPVGIYTILNTDTGALDKLIESQKSVQTKVRIVSGDNIEIITVNGEKFP